MNYTIRFIVIVHLFLTASLHAQTPGYDYLRRFECSERAATDGMPIAPAGDVNNDGYSDVIVGSFFKVEDQATTDGAAKVISGLDGAVLHEWKPTKNFEFIGYSVAGAGDVNADGYDDVIVTSMDNRSINGVIQDISGDSNGFVSVFSGKHGTLLHRFFEEDLGDNFGLGVATPGDIDNDGFSDILVTATTAGSLGNGYVVVFSGKTGAELWRLDFQSGGHFWPWVAKGLGDVNNDGHDDFILEALFNGSNDTEHGVLTLYSGKDQSVIHTFAKGLAHVQYWDIVGDIDLDGVPDIGYGIKGNNFNADPRDTIFLYSGKTGNLIRTIREYGVLKWYTLVGVGDQNFDGVPDILSGKTLLSGADGDIIFTFPSDWRVRETSTAGLVGSLGDLNRDGLPDIYLDFVSQGGFSNCNFVVLSLDYCPESDSFVDGICGCAGPAIDDDADGFYQYVPNNEMCTDRCDQNPDRTGIGLCGCDYKDVDIDKNGILDCFEDLDFEPPVPMVPTTRGDTKKIIRAAMKLTRGLIFETPATGISIQNMRETLANTGAVLAALQSEALYKRGEVMLLRRLSKLLSRIRIGSNRNPRIKLKSKRAARLARRLNKRMKNTP